MPTFEPSEEANKAFEDLFSFLEKEEEEFWNSLTKEQQLLVFCAVTRRLAKGELVDQRSYRGILYDTFDFDFDSYVRAQNAGFLELHNAIVVDDGK